MKYYFKINETDGGILHLRVKSSFEAISLPYN